MYIANDGFPVFINREQPKEIKKDYTKFNDILLNEELDLRNLMKFDFKSVDEVIKYEIRNQLLKLIQQFIMLFGCYRERIIYSIEEINRWKLYDYKNPDIEYMIDALSINSVEIFKLEDSIGISLWTWADYYSKWCLVYYQFQLFADGIHPNVFPLYRIPVYAGAISQDD